MFLVPFLYVLGAFISLAILSSQSTFIPVLDIFWAAIYPVLIVILIIWYFCEWVNAFLRQDRRKLT